MGKFENWIEFNFCVIIVQPQPDIVHFFFLGTLTVFQPNLKKLEVSDMIFWNIILAVYQSGLLIKIKHLKSFIDKYTLGASLVVQSLKIRLPMQGHEFNPWFRKIPHAGGQLSPCTALLSLICRARELQLLSLSVTTAAALAPQSQSP